MKYLNSLLLAPLVFGMLFLAGCKGDDEPDPEPTPAQENFELLQNVTWVPTSVTRDGDDVTSEFSGFELSFGGTLTDDKSNVNGTYDTTNGGEIWPSSGAWEFGEDVTSAIIRGDGLEIDYNVTENTLTLTFIYSTDDSSGNRTKVVDGEYVFELEASS